MAARSGGGFWRGFLTGALLAAGIALALAWTFPPLRAPQVDETSFRPPGAPSEPSATGRPGAATPETGLPARDGLPVAPPPEPDRAP